MLIIPLHTDRRSLSCDDHSGNDGHGGKVTDLKKQASHDKGVGGSSLAGTRHKQAQSAGPFSSAFGEPPQGGSEQGGSVSEGGGDFIDILSGTL